MPFFLINPTHNNRKCKEVNCTDAFPDDSVPKFVSTRRTPILSLSLQPVFHGLSLSKEMPYFHLQSLLAKPLVASYHDYATLTCLGFFEWHKINRILSIYVVQPKVAKASRCGIITWTLVPFYEPTWVKDPNIRLLTFRRNIWQNDINQNDM
jgi:hypothetical protein